MGSAQALSTNLISLLFSGWGVSWTMKGLRGVLTSRHLILPSLINVKRRAKIFLVICKLSISPTLEAVLNVKVHMTREISHLKNTLI